MYHTNTDDVIWIVRGHKRKPNWVVRTLYALGDNIADFGPMFINLFNVFYTNIRKLFGFIVDLLIELSTVIILLATITFSIFHSVELLREAGASNGLEYIGLLIFEVLFISSTASLTRQLIQDKTVNPFSVAGFFVGIIFVFWSNITGMAQNWTGWIIGGLIPIMLIITEGTLAYQAYRRKNKKELDLSDIIKRYPNMTEQDFLKAIEMYLVDRTRNPEHEHLNKEHPEQIEHKRVQPKQTDLEQTNIEHEQVEHKQAEHGQVEREQTEREQTEREQVERTEHEQIEQPEHEHAEQTGYEQPEHEQVEQIEHEQVEQAKHERAEQIEHERIEQTEHKQVEQTERKQDEHKHEQLEQVEQNEQHKIEQTDEHEQKRKQSERVQRKTKLYLVKGRGQSKVDIAIKCALKLIEQNKEFTVRELAEMAGCSLGTAQNAMNKLKEQKKIAQ